jgi:hypothetical protein
VRSSLTATCALLISVLGLAGCGGDDEGAGEQVSSVIETATEAVPQSIEVELAEVNASGQSGTATLSANDDGTLNVTIDLSGGLTNRSRRTSTRDLAQMSARLSLP